MNTHQPDAPTQLAEDTDWAGDELREECGVFGIFGHEDATTLVALGLQALQHRGQEAAGIVSSDGKQFYAERRMGLVSDSFTKPSVMKRLAGNSAIGHVRYSTTGETVLRNVQPLFADLAGGGFALAHNGNLTNALTLRKQLEKSGAIFQSTSDTETILHLIARSPKSCTVDRVIDALYEINGAYALVGIANDKLIGVRDPLGIRPLVLGKMNESYIFASETCALDIIGAKFVREVENGEVVVISAEGIKSYNPFPKKPERPCIFEYIYFARPDSIVGGKSIYECRKGFGRELAKESNVEADMVIPIPDSGVPSAIGYAEQAGIPFELGITRNHYVGRTFIQPKQSIRSFGVRLKHNANRTLVTGKRIVLIDDSIVRGTTLRESIITILSRLNPKKIIIVSSAPPIQYPDCYGIDMSHLHRFIAFQAAIELLKDEGRLDLLDAVEHDCRQQADADPAEMVNHVKRIYEPFSLNTLSAKIAELIRPTDVAWDGELEVIYQDVDGLRAAMPEFTGDWYFTGDYPTPGGMAVLNQSYLNWRAGLDTRAY